LKKTCLFLAFLFCFSSGAFAQTMMRADYNGDNAISWDDVAIYFAHTQLVDEETTPTLANVGTRAKAVYPLFNQTKGVTRLPGTYDDLNVDGARDWSDVAFCFAHVQMVDNEDPKAQDFTGVQDKAKVIFKLLSSKALDSFPGWPIGSGTVPITISGISTTTSSIRRP